MSCCRPCAPVWIQFMISGGTPGMAGAAPGAAAAGAAAAAGSKFCSGHAVAFAFFKVPNGAAGALAHAMPRRPATRHGAAKERELRKDVWLCMGTPITTVERGWGAG